MLSLWRPAPRRWQGWTLTDMCRTLGEPAAAACEAADDLAQEEKVGTTLPQNGPHIEFTTSEPAGFLYQQQAAHAAQHARDAASGRNSALREEPGAGTEPRQEAGTPPGK